MLVQAFLWGSVFLSLLFFLTNSVLMVGAVCLTFSMVVCFLTMGVFGTWFGAVVILVYVGGLMVMFSYFLAISPNQSFSSVSLFVLFGGFFSVFVGGMGVKHFFSPLPAGGYMAIDFLFSGGFGYFIFLVSFLLLCLFCVVSIVGLCSGPLRPFSSGGYGL